MLRLVVTPRRIVKGNHNGEIASPRSANDSLHAASRRLSPGSAMTATPASPDDILIRGCPCDEATRWTALERFGKASVDVLVIPARDTAAWPSVWSRLPAGIAALIADPFKTATVLLRPAAGGDPSQEPVRVLEAIQGGSFRVESDLSLEPRPFRRPTLAPTHNPKLSRETQAGLPSLFKSWESTLGPGPDVIALRAGVLQLLDQLDASHEASQSIEGEGVHQNGDYWHAINHRREPDYGNGKYWFRQVGPHPLLNELAGDVEAIIAAAPTATRSSARDLVQSGRLDPFKFIDFVESAVRTRNADAIALAEQIQWREMVCLLEHTWRDASAG